MERSRKNGSTNEELTTRCRELELALSLWMAANEAKAERIGELEAECARLQQRVARVSRRAEREQRPSRLQQLRHAR